MQIIIFFIFILAVILYISNFNLSVNHYSVESPKIPKSFNGFKILQISDLHNRSFGKNNSDIIKIINIQNPNIVVFTGDMISYHDKNFEPFYCLAKTVSQSFPSYYITGNHEQSLDWETEHSYYDFLEKLRSFGMVVLENQSVNIDNGVDYISIYGYTHNVYYYKHLTPGSGRKKRNRLTLKEMQNAMGEKKDKNYTVLLTHNPIFFDVYAAWGADLTISGHMHGGVVRLPLIKGLLSAERIFFPKYNGGLYNINDKTLMVSRGIGNTYGAVRIGSIPEIVVITLNKKST